MKKVLLIMLLAATLSAQSCVAIENGNLSSNDIDVNENGNSASVPEASEESPSETSEETHTKDASFVSFDDKSSEEISETADITYTYAIDIKPYLQSIYSENLLFVNKQVHLRSDDVPSNLVDITYMRKDRDKQKMDAVAEKALCAFLEEAYYYGYSDVTVTSGYRSYGTQAWLYQNYVNNEKASGKTEEQAIAAANKYSAKAGQSEHQTGLCVDMHNLGAANQSFGYTEAGKWLAENAHRFGFILRFPKGKEDITGYNYEPWHFRFVGVKHASVMFNEGLCFEEYIGKYYPDKEKGN